MARTFKIRFDSAPRRFALLAILSLIGGAYLVLTTSQLAASWLGNRAQLTSLQRAIRLDPGNADYHDRLGRFHELEELDPASAIKQYAEAVQLVPNASRYWLDLAGAYRVLGDTANQAAAIERAVSVDPMTPDVAWEAANLYMARGDDEKALHQLSIVIANDPYLADSALESCWRIKPDVDALLENVIPPQSEAYLAFLKLLQGKQDTAGTIKVWDRLMQMNRPFERKDSFNYIHYLILHKEVDAAIKAWQQSTSLFGLSSYLPSSANLVVNGNFDFEVLDAGFDWQYQKQSSVRLVLDPSNTHGGHRSLLASFDGPGISDAGFFQFVALQPNTTYNFRAYFKSGEMEGAGGPHFTIQDVYQPQTIYYESDELKDSDYWRLTQGQFTTGPDCKLVVLHIRRLPLGSPMRGKLWVGDFRITQNQ